MRKFAIIAVFVLANGIGFAYRTLTRTRESQFANPPAMASDRTPDQKTVLAPAHSKSDSVNSSAPPPPATGNSRSDAASAIETAPAPAAKLPANAASPTISDDARTVGRARPRPQPARVAPVVARPRPGASAPATPAPAAPAGKTDTPTHDEDSLLKMEANPYKRGE